MKFLESLYEIAKNVFMTLVGCDISDQNCINGSDFLPTRAHPRIHGHPIAEPDPVTCHGYAEFFDVSSP